MFFRSQSSHNLHIKPPLSEDKRVATIQRVMKRHRDTSPEPKPNEIGSEQSGSSSGVSASASGMCS